ncbi:MAG: hypothetical protein ACXVP4_10295 [Bacteroidia bacterium]
MKYIVVTSLIIFSSLLVKAQDVRKPQSDSLIKVIPVGEGRHASYLYTVGGKLQTGEDVAVRLLAYAPSAVEFKKAKNSITWTYISASGFAASSIGAVIEFKNNNKNAGATTGFVNGSPGIIYSKHNLTGAYIFTGAATGFLFSTLFHLIKTSAHSKKAIELYNRKYQ